MEFDPENMFKLNAENMYLMGVIETMKAENHVLKEKLEASENSVSRLNAEILVMNDTKKHEMAVLKNRSHPKFQRMRSCRYEELDIIHFQSAKSNQSDDKENQPSQIISASTIKKVPNQLKNNRAEIWDITKLDFEALTGMTLSHWLTHSTLDSKKLSDWLIHSKPKFNWQSAPSIGHPFQEKCINIEKLPAEDEKTTGTKTDNVPSEPEKSSNEALRKFFQGLLDKHAPKSIGSKVPPKVTSSILIIHGLTDDIRNQTWLEEKLGRYGHMQKITLGKISNL